MASLFTGLLPSQHGVGMERGEDRKTPHALAPEIETLAELLRDAGYRTAAFVANPWLEPRFGFDQGFELYDASFARWGTSNEEAKLPGVDVSAKALEWLATIPPDQPYFLFVHFLDSHRPYPVLHLRDLEAQRDRIAADTRELPPQTQRELRANLRIQGTRRRAAAARRAARRDARARVREGHRALRLRARAAARRSRAAPGRRARGGDRDVGPRRGALRARLRQSRPRAPRGRGRDPARDEAARRRRTRGRRAVPRRSGRRDADALHLSRARLPRALVGPGPARAASRPSLHRVGGDRHLAASPRDPQRRLEADLAARRRARRRAREPYRSTRSSATRPKRTIASRIRRSAARSSGCRVRSRRRDPREPLHTAPRVSGRRRRRGTARALGYVD